MIRSRIDTGYQLFLGIVSALMLVAFVLLLFYRLLFTNQVLANGDILHYFYPYRDYAAEAFRSGRIPLWNPYIFLGVPFLANPQAAVLYPLHWPLSWLPVTKQIYWSAAIHAWILGFGGYCLMRQWRYTPCAALSTGLILAGSGFYGGLIGHINQMNGAAWLPWTILMIERWRGRNIYWSTAVGWLGVCIALMLLAGHTQTAYINLFGLGLWLIFPAFLHLALRFSAPWFEQLVGIQASHIASNKASPRGDTQMAHNCDPHFGRAIPLGANIESGDGEQKWWQNLGGGLAIYLGAVLLGGGLSLAQLLPTLELSGLGLRQGGLSYAEASSFSLNVLKLPFTLLPSYGLVDLSVTFSTLGYSEFVAYIGLSGLMLAGVALWRTNSLIRIGAILLASAGLFLAIGRWNPAYWLLYKIVPGFDLFRTPARWMMLYTMGMALLAGIGFEYLARFFSLKLGPRKQWVSQAILLLVICIELILAAHSLPHTQTTAAQAVTDLRTAVAHLLTDPLRSVPDNEIDPSAAGRFLSMSTITFDPGDMHTYRQLWVEEDSLQITEPAFNQFVVALKSQEILAPNLSMLWRVPSVDGFDGGVLPLQRYIKAQPLFVADEKIVPDGRLREQVKEFPDTRLLDIFNIQYVITDKVQDLWYQGIYYDRQIGAFLAIGPNSRQHVVVDVPTQFEATRLDLIGALMANDKAIELLKEVTVNALRVEVLAPNLDASKHRYWVTAGGGNGALWADGRLGSAMAISSGSEVAFQNVEQKRQEYIARIGLSEPLSPQSISISLTQELLDFMGGLESDVGPGISFQIQAATLVDERTGMFQPLVTSGRGSIAFVHGGDVKIYENVDTLPRSYLAYDVISVSGTEEAFATLQKHLITNTFDDMSVAKTNSALNDEAGKWAVVEGIDSFTSRPGPADNVKVVSYQPERIELLVQNESEALLVLSDTYYPGWRAKVNHINAEIHPVNGLFRGVLIPSGSHNVIFEYRPISWEMGLRGSVAGVVLLGLCFILPIVRKWNKVLPTKVRLR